MRKPVLIAAGAVLLAAAVSAFVYVKNESNSMNELFNATVEALARFEDGGTQLCYRYHPFGIQRYGIYCNNDTRPPQIYPCTQPYSDRMSSTSQCY